MDHLRGPGDGAARVPLISPALPLSPCPWRPLWELQVKPDAARHPLPCPAGEPAPPLLHPQHSICWVRPWHAVVAKESHSGSCDFSIPIIGRTLVGVLAFSWSLDMALTAPSSLHLLLLSASHSEDLWNTPKDLSLICKL